MPLDAAGKAAHEGVLQQTYGRHKLPRALRVAVTDYLVAKGWAVVDVPYDIDASDEAGMDGRPNGSHTYLMRARMAKRRQS